MEGTMMGAYVGMFMVLAAFASETREQYQAVQLAT